METDSAVYIFGKFLQSNQKNTAAMINPMNSLCEHMRSHWVIIIIIIFRWIKSKHKQRTVLVCRMDGRTLIHFGVVEMEILNRDSIKRLKFDRLEYYYFFPRARDAMRIWRVKLLSFWRAHVIEIVRPFESPLMNFKLDAGCCIASHWCVCDRWMGRMNANAENSSRMLCWHFFFFFVFRFFEFAGGNWTECKEIFWIQYENFQRRKRFETRCQIAPIVLISPTEAGSPVWYAAESPNVTIAKKKIMNEFTIKRDRNKLTARKKHKKMVCTCRLRRYSPKQIIKCFHKEVYSRDCAYAESPAKICGPARLKWIIFHNTTYELGEGRVGYNVWEERVAQDCRFLNVV